MLLGHLMTEPHELWPQGGHREVLRHLNEFIHPSAGDEFSGELDKVRGGSFVGLDAVASARRLRPRPTISPLAQLRP